MSLGSNILENKCSLFPVSSLQMASGKWGRSEPPRPKQLAGRNSCPLSRDFPTFLRSEKPDNRLNLHRLPPGIQEWTDRVWRCAVGGRDSWPWKARSWVGCAHLEAGCQLGEQEEQRTSETVTAEQPGRLGPPQGPLVLLLPCEGSPSISSCLWPVSQIVADLSPLPGALPKPADPQ